MRKNNWESATTSGCTLAFALLLAVAIAQSAHAQAFTVLHEFTGGADGSTPQAGLTIDAAGNLYGTTCDGGSRGYGTVFKLTRKSSGWVFATLYEFRGNPSNDGYCPSARVVFGPDGALYGTTYAGGGTQASCFSAGFIGCGTVFKLTPPATVCRAISCPWTETVLYRFQGGTDGQQPTSEVTFDRSGNIYGTTFFGMTQGSCYEGFGCGGVYKLTHSGGSWMESILYSFTGGNDGGEPFDGVIFDDAGAIYGTAVVGGTGNGCGTVFKLMSSGSGWTETVLLDLCPLSDTVGRWPWAGLFFDASGNLFGATGSTHHDPITSGGAVFKLTSFDGGWTPTVVYSFDGYSECGWFSCGPLRKVAMDASGSIYGTTYGDGAYYSGSVFKLSAVGNGWEYNSLHDFCGAGPPCSDGDFPISNLVLDMNGNLYGTTSHGGTYGLGVVFEITP